MENAAGMTKDRLAVHETRQRGYWPTDGADLTHIGARMLQSEPDKLQSDTNSAKTVFAVATTAGKVSGMPVWRCCWPGGSINDWRSRCCIRRRSVGNGQRPQVGSAWRCIAGQSQAPQEGRGGR